MFAAIAHVRSCRIADQHAEAHRGVLRDDGRRRTSALLPCRQLRYLSPPWRLRPEALRPRLTTGMPFARRGVDRAKELISTCHQWQTRGNSERAIKVNGALTTK